jgi:sodium/hydrogen antiporter
MVIVGLAILMTAFLPRVSKSRPFALPIVALVFGFTVFSLPWGPMPFDVIERMTWIHGITELGLALALMSAGLKIDRRPGLRRWRTTWRIFLIAMPLTIIAAGALAWGLAGFALATAVLVAASVVPTDPVLAGDVETRPPEQLEASAADDRDGVHDEEREVRLALTSEAGFSDAVAFPLTYLAILIATAGSLSGDGLGHWLAWDVAYRVGSAIVIGIVAGRILAHIILGARRSSSFGELMTGLGSVAAALLVYGAAESAESAGFLAVFIAGLTIRNANPQHRHQVPLREVVEIATRLASTGILVMLGGAVAGGLLAALDWKLALLAVLMIVVVRPAAAILALSGCAYLHWRERAVISFFGIRGIGSLFYMSLGLTAARFAQAEELAALIGLIVVMSVLIHGMLAAPVMSAMHCWEARRASELPATAESTPGGRPRT